MPEEIRHCEECGGDLVEGLSCWDQLCRILAWEWDDAELAAHHFVTVASYNLQHPSAMTEDAYAGLRAVYVAHFDDGLGIEETRRRVGKQVAGATRVLRHPDERVIVPRSWTRTISSVYRPGQPAGAAGRVAAWSAATRADL